MMRFPRKSNHAPILDLVGSLSSYGINEYLDLPQIIVCGDQSSGKSSALEAISRVPFAVQDELFTRFATEIILRRQEVKDIRAFIINSSSRHNDNDNNTVFREFPVGQGHGDILHGEASKHHPGPACRLRAPPQHFPSL
ncbi:hypothetical protein PG987_008493 [Apiospora arundinis]